MNLSRMLRGAALTAVTAMTLPAAASAATATVTGDDGAPLPLSAAPTQIRNMSPVIGITFDAATEDHYSVLVTAPDGRVANLGEYCLNTSSYEPEKVKYLGNGPYTVTIKTGKGKCDRVSTTTFSIQAGTAIAAPTGRLLFRKPDTFDFIDYQVPVAGNPGADEIEVRYAKDAVLAPDNTILNSPSSASWNASSGTANVSFLGPGTYTFVTRANDYGGASTAWTAPIRVQVVAPFDLLGGSSALSFPDSRGPSYKIAAQVREKTARGKIRVYLAKGRKGGKFRRIGTAKIRSEGKFSIRFKERRRGSFRIRFKFGGSKTVAGGTQQYGIKIRRTVF